MQTKVMSACQSHGFPGHMDADGVWVCDRHGKIIGPGCPPHHYSDDDPPPNPSDEDKAYAAACLAKVAQRLGLCK